MSEKKQWELRVKCLVLDHDDTVVKSTPEINFPAFLRSLKDLRGTTMSYEQFVEYNFDPGFYEMCADILHYTPEEIRYQEAEWERAAAVTIPMRACRRYCILTWKMVAKSVCLPIPCERRF